MRVAPALAVWAGWTSLVGTVLGAVGTLASASRACALGTGIFACTFAFVSLCSRWAVSWDADLVVMGARPWIGVSETKTEARREARPCLVLLHPHGLCVGMVILCQSRAGFSQSPRSSCAVNALGALGGLAQFGWRGIKPDAVAAQMARGCDILVYPGGHRECTQHDRTRDIANVGSRGAIRLALVHGYDVRVAYAFGERTIAVNVRGCARIRAWLASCRVPAIVPIPTRAVLDARAVRVAVSAPCAFPALRDPSDADVSRWHALYVAELCSLHAEFRSEGDPRQLTLV